MRMHRRSFGLAIALGISAALHAAVLSWLGDRLPKPGIETASNAAAVEIILQAPPAPPVEAVQGEQAASDQRSETAISPEAPASVELPEAAEPIVPDSPTPAEPPMPDPASHRLTQADGEPAAPPEEALSASVILPSADIPVPTPRPGPLKAKPEPSTKTMRAEPKQASPPTTGKAPARKAEKAMPAKNRQPAPSKQNAGRKGGATTGEKAAYSRRLLSHVQRYKRYPREAARDGLSGAAGLNIAIDRRGNLAGARLVKSSGHAVLDQEALAVARRAAPYPRPPEGIGGNTISFSVTLRFKR